MSDEIKGNSISGERALNILTAFKKAKKWNPTGDYIVTQIDSEEALIDLTDNKILVQGNLPSGSFLD